MDLFDILKADGVDLRRVAVTSGGEFCGACPFCGGRDRFRVWPESKGGRYWCRRCDRKGDALQYLRDARGFTYLEACEHLGVSMKDRMPRPMHRKREAPRFIPRESEAPPSIWQAEATIFFQQAQRTLWTDRGREARAFLYERGLQDVSMQDLGWTATEKYIHRETWGLLTDRRADGRPKRLWLPTGLVIPLWGPDRKVIRLRIRRRDPDAGPRYIVVSGSIMAPMVWGADRDIFTVVESELDGFLIWQEAGDLTGVIALGSVSAKPDRITHGSLTKARLILVSLDSDDAGARASWHFWPSTYGAKVKRWPVPVGKDPSDAWRKGVDIRIWILAGLKEN